MASSYVNNLRLEEIATGEQSGTWGDTTNTNLEIIGQAVAWGTRAIANASTDNITIADGALDADRCLGLKLTGGGQACTVTLLPNTSSKTWFMYNATAAALTFTCGSGANVIIPAGHTKVIATDGLGSGGVVHDLLTAVNLAGTTTVDDLIVSDDMVVADDASVGGTLGVTGIATFTDDIIIGNGKTIGSASDVDAITIAANGQVTLTQTLIGTALDISGDIDVDGTTNLDIVDIDGAVDMASTLQLDGAVTLGVAGTSNGFINSPSGIFINIDSDNDSTDRFFDIRKDSADGSGALLFKVAEDGAVTIPATALVTGVLTTTAAAVFTGGFAANQESTIIAADGQADNGFVLTIKNQEATDDRSFGLRIEAGSTASDLPLNIETHDGGTALFQLAGNGQARFVDGTASLPSISNLNGPDLNTGIFFPAADTIAFTEGGVESVRITNEGQVLIGAVASQSVLLGTGNALQLQGLNSNTSGISTTRHTNDGGGGYLNFGKSRGTADGAVTVVADDDILGQIFWSGADGTDIKTPAASIKGRVDGTPGSNDMPGRLVFSTTADGAAAVTERMRLNSGGQLLFAKAVTTITTDGAVLDSGQLTVSAASSSTNHATANGGSIALCNGNSTDTNFSHIGGYNANGLVTSQINFINQVQSSRRGVMSFNTHDGSSMPERGRFNNFGQFLVGCTQIPSASVPGFGVANNAGFCFTLHATSDTGLNTCTDFINPNGVVGKIATNGSATTFSTSSDYRLKENVVYAWDATTRLKQLKPARFNFIADANKTVDGFLAHEAQAVVPEAVTGTKDAVLVWKEYEELPDGVSVGDTKLDTDGNTMPDVQGIDQSKLVPLLVKTIQELEARITALEA